MPQALDSLTIQTQAQLIADRYLDRTPAPGHPSTIADTEKVSLLLASLADGNYRETACLVAGIPKQTFYQWLKRADAGEDAAIAFKDAVEKAEAAAEAGLVQNVRQASKLPQFWAAGMTLLERKSPDKWGRRQDDSSAPKVIVQIGIRDSDVSISTLSPVPRNELTE